ncbi:putative membrane protein [Thermoanaerobacter sp. YS13]|uniref:QueT transporter family protein n=1 Tax=Thermoanaerobacter sp. YS13 TaxID=1511746 RepID=UPI000574B212|nr:QueT transporter family protein [Thermoanaerobacter sp. YS13]KHO62344.1 putative membrane protein [Thermoanaerobacter sp. YS13]
MKRIDTKYIVKAGVIAAIYFVVTILLGSVSYGPIQFRISESLVVLPMVEPAAIWGVFIGCLLANIGSPFGLFDILGGSLVTLLAAYLTSKTNIFYKSILPPIILNAIIVSIWVSYFTKMPYYLVALYIALSEAIVTGVFGYVVITVYKRLKDKYSL